MNESKSRTQRILFVSAIVLFFTTSELIAAPPPDDARALFAQCTSTQWNSYASCQLRLLEVMRAGNYCVPQPANGARYQYEFAQYARSNPEVLAIGDANAVGAAFFTSAYPCL